MKKFFKSFFVMAAVSATIIACNKETPAQVGDEGLVKVTIVSGNPAAESATRTMIDENLVPYWTAGDIIGVTTGAEGSNYEFQTDINAPATTASFTGSAAASTDYYAYYPFSSTGVGAKGAKVEIPAVQEPLQTTYDPAGDILVSKKFAVAEPQPGSTSVTVDGLEFKRLVSVVKLVLKDVDGVMADAAQLTSEVSMTADTDLVGRVYVDFAAQDFNAEEGIYYNKSKTVTAKYGPNTKYEIDGTNATWLIVYPQTLAEGSNLTIKASTEDYSILKSVTVPVGGITLEAGKVTTLIVNLSSEHITPAERGDALPFADNMSWADSGSDSSNDIANTISEESGGLYTAGSKAYKGAGGLKLGTSSANGYITTKELDLSGKFFIAVKGESYHNNNNNNNDGSKLVVSIDGEVVINADFDDVNYVEIPAGRFSKKAKVTIGTDAKRGRIYSVKIKSGAYAPDPVINVSSDYNPFEVDTEGGSQSFSFTIDNPVDGAAPSASSDDEWIKSVTVDITPNGNYVNFEVDAQEAGAVSRSGVITLSYADAEAVEVTVNQAPGQGGTTDWAATETSNVTLAAGTNGSSALVNDNTAIKVGTGKKGGDMKITVPAGTTKLHIHAAAWNGVSGLSLNISGATATPASLSLTADDGVSNSSPFTLSGSPKDFYFEVTLTGVNAETVLTLASSSAKRFVVWGCNAE